MIPLPAISLFDALGFHWDRSAVPANVPRYSVGGAVFRFHKMLPEFVWDASMMAFLADCHPEATAIPAPPADDPDHLNTMAP